MSKADPSIHFAGTFAAKEAAIKALSTFQTGGITLADLEVTHGKEGAPMVSYGGSNAKLREVEVVVSVSHTSEYAVASALSIRRR